jgi:hypothetical protein
MQQTHQIPADLLKEILGNVSTLLSFNVSRDDASILRNEFLLDLGDEVSSIPIDFLQTLKIGEAWGKIGRTSFPLTTMLADQYPNPIRAKEVIERSRRNYAQPINDKPSDPPHNKPDDDEDIDPFQVF